MLAAYLRTMTSSFPRLTTWHFYYQLLYLRRVMELLCGFVIIQWGHVPFHFSISSNKSGIWTMSTMGFYQVLFPYLLFRLTLLCTTQIWLIWHQNPFWFHLITIHRILEGLNRLTWVYKICFVVSNCCGNRSSSEAQCEDCSQVKRQCKLVLPFC